MNSSHVLRSRLFLVSEVNQSERRTQTCRSVMKFQTPRTLWGSVSKFRILCTQCRPVSKFSNFSSICDQNKQAGVTAVQGVIALECNCTLNCGTIYISNNFLHQQPESERALLAILFWVRWVDGALSSHHSCGNAGWHRHMLADQSWGFGTFLKVHC